MMNRRSFLATILAAASAPAIVRASSLMPVRPVGSLILPGEYGYSAVGPFPPPDFTERALEDALIEMHNWTNDKGLFVRPTKLMVPPALYAVARDILESKERVAFDVLNRGFLGRA